jgi:glutamate/tyrosine decarboxylase-like PLP-dependent enzyme
MTAREDRPSRPQLPDVDFDWDASAWRRAGQRLLDLAVAASTGWEKRPPAPQSDVARPAELGGALGAAPVSIDQIAALLETHVLPAAAYNGHPRFFGYITSAPAPIGVLGDMLASALNQNVGLWRLAPAATAIELQTINWIKDIVGYPRSAEGIYISGGQMANVLAYAVFRSAKTPWDDRAHGLHGPDGEAPRVRVYTSEEAHYCHDQAAEFLGFGRDAVRHVPVDDQYRMRIDALSSMIDDDRSAGDLPIAIAATAGTVGTGAIDPLPELVTVARSEGLWLHVDGAYGAFAAIAPSAPSSLRALADADSIACDPHKWLFAPVDAGVTLVRQPGLLDAAFAFEPSYLGAGHDPARIDLYERTPENSRRFRALKVWMAFQAYGRDGYRDMIERNIRLAAYMEDLVRATPGLELAAPRELSIVCWRSVPDGVDAARIDELQSKIIVELERRGIAFISNAKLRDGSAALRACIVNFRTGVDDVEALVNASAEIGRELGGQ